MNKSDAEIRVRIEKIIKDLGLEKCRDTWIGNHLFRGLSGGEKKRTAIGVELITDPSVIFLDEPTSGLDSHNALKIVKILDKQARAGKTIIATIHQPSSQIFKSFDRLLLLMEGYAIYQGSASESVKYFAEHGYQCPEYSNPADYFLREFSVPKIQDSAYIQKTRSLSEKYNSILLPQVSSDNISINLDELNEKEILKNFSSVSFFTELWLLMKRTALDIYRNPMYMRMRIGQTVFTSLLNLCLFYKLGFDLQGVNDKVGLLFFVCVDQFMITVMTVLMVFLNERDVFLREYANKTYGLITYYLAKTVVEMPFLLMMPVLHGSLYYFGVGLDKSLDKFLWFQVINMCVAF